MELSITLVWYQPESSMVSFERGNTMCWNRDFWLGKSLHRSTTCFLGMSLRSLTLCSRAVSACFDGSIALRDRSGTCGPFPKSWANGGSPVSWISHQPPSHCGYPRSSRQWKSPAPILGRNRRGSRWGRASRAVVVSVVWISGSRVTSWYDEWDWPNVKKEITDIFGLQFCS